MIIQRKRIYVCCLTFACVLFVTRTSNAQARNALLYQQSFSGVPGFVQEYNQVATLSQAHDLAGLEKMAGDLQSRSSDEKTYFALIDAITAAMSSYNFGLKNINQKELLARKYALLVLEKPNVPLDVAVHLLPRIVYEDTWDYTEDKTVGTAWATQRTNRMKLWFNTWQRFDQLNDKLYDPYHVDSHFMKLLNRTVLPPENISLEQHQQDVKELAQIRQERNAQGVLRQLRGQFLPVFEANLVSSYSKAPYDSSELKQFLDKYIEDIAVKQTILNQTATNIAASQK
jgi:hypothetical protein